MLACVVAFADGTRFSDVAPLASSAGPTADESMPVTFGNDFRQRSIADRDTQLFALKPNSGEWHMITTNETGPDKGRFLFTVFETDQAGVQRHDLLTGETDTIWHSLTEGSHVSFDPSFWTPWGTLITGEEEWCTDAAGCTSPYGRLFEFKNPVDAPPIFEPLGPNSNDGAVFVHQNVIPRTSHEGIQFDRDGNMYFIDELNGGNLYKYTSAASFASVKNGSADYFASGQTFVLRVGNGNVANATGPYHLGADYEREWRRAAGSDHHYGYQRRYVGRCSQHHGSARFQGDGLSAPRRHADADGRWSRLSVRDDDHDQRDLQTESEDEHDLCLRQPNDHQSRDGCGGRQQFGERR
jgi:hypothetical protein